MKNKKIGQYFIVTLLCFFTSISTAAASIINLNFDSLPSAQGWSYSSSGAPEGSVFSIIGGNTLQQNTIGIGDHAGANYQLWGALDLHLTVTLSFTARLINEEGAPTDFGALSVGLALGNEMFGIALGSDRIKDIGNNILTTSIDTSIFHDYELIVNPGVGYSLLVDGSLIATGSPEIIFSPLNYIWLGDSSDLNAKGEYTALSVSQVPEPSSAILTILGLGVMFLSLRIRRKM